jgi:hypothetical protein
MDIGEAFLDHPKHCDFNIAWQAPEIVRAIEIDLDMAALGKALDIPANSGRETCLVEQWYSACLLTSSPR